MKELINKNVEELVKKYSPLLETIKDIELKSQLAYVFDTAVNYIKEKHNSLSIDWKSWAIFILRTPEIYNTLSNNGDIINVIEDFVGFYNKNYQHYVNELVTQGDDFELKQNFVYKYINKNKPKIN
jgi:hypothetical protein